MTKETTKAKMVYSHSPGGKIHITPLIIQDLEALAARTEERYGPMTCDMACLGVITEEYHEVIEAIRVGEAWRVRAELLDLANSCIRRIITLDEQMAKEGRIRG